MINEFQGKWTVFSNFVPCSITYKGILYPTTEHAYMSAKSDSLEWKETCSNFQLRPGAVKKLGRKVQLRSDWEEVKEQVMEDVLRLKFSQPKFKHILLETGNEVIQEGNYWNDKIWGVCLKTGVGKNLLGKLLMKIRTEYQENENIIIS